jgi:hypothetical protein
MSKGRRREVLTDELPDLWVEDAHELGLPFLVLRGKAGKIESV